MQRYLDRLKREQMKIKNINQKIIKSEELLNLSDKNKDLDAKGTIELLNELNKNIQECLTLLDED